MQHRALVLVIGFAVGAVLCSAQLTSYHNNANKVSNSQLTPSISGTVTGIDGTPVHDIRIELRSLANGAALQKCLSSADGTYDLTRLRPGKYELVAEDGVNEARERVTVGTGASNVDLHMKAHVRAPMSPSVSVAALRIPDKARHLLEKARNAINKNRWQEAEKFVASALMVSPDYADALTTRAILKMIARQTDSALDDLDHAIKSDPESGPAYLVLGAILDDQGRFDEALRSLDRSERTTPNSWQCAFERGKAWLGKQDYEHALQQFNRAESLGGVQVLGEIHILRGYAFLGERHFDLASKEFEAYLSSEPKGEQAGRVRAVLAQVKTRMAQRADSIALPAVPGFFGSVH